MVEHKKYSSNLSQHLLQQLLKFQQAPFHYHQEDYLQDGQWSSGRITATNTSSNY
jgi:hypothetical protein